ncbi:hypothetical protein QC763_0052590 [Podospora pseudopauciseta]|uniref:Uncharacterized protein n=1 Tax=Podospora pseudopauciseta TaxID=2093780 RepID=A0ABR0HFX0_9PEZI|nr:hypothetical protein QC763_0052590 [Podospora pseudopauciseta]
MTQPSLPKVISEYRSNINIHSPKGNVQPCPATINTAMPAHTAVASTSNDAPSAATVAAQSCLEMRLKFCSDGTFEKIAGAPRAFFRDNRSMTDSQLAKEVARMELLVAYEKPAVTGVSLPPGETTSTTEENTAVDVGASALPIKSMNTESFKAATAGTKLPGPVDKNVGSKPTNTNIAPAHIGNPAAMDEILNQFLLAADRPISVASGALTKMRKLSSTSSREVKSFIVR